MKRLLAIILTIIMAVSVVGMVTVFAEQGSIEVISTGNEIQISINGEKINFTEQPFIDENDRTQVPVRELCEFLNKKVYWFENPQRVLISKVPANADTLNGHAGGDNIQLVIGESQYTVNGQVYDMDTAARIVNGRTYIPLRTVGEFLQYYVVWKDKTDIIQTENLDLSNVLELPRTTIKSFFSSFAQGDFESMKQYCTQECIDNHFHAEHGDVFGLKKAELLSADTTQTFYDTPPDEYVVFVYLKVEPSEYSSIYPSTDFGFFVHLLRQADGTYLINNFSTSGI